MKWLAAAAGVVLVLFLLWRSIPSTRPTTLGVRGGRLRDCPPSPNCVCSQASRPEQQIDPLPYDGEPADALRQLQAVVGAMPRTQIIAVAERYLHAEFTTPICQYVDDVEFLVDPTAKVIQLRSASRVGHSDLGVNRTRVKEIQNRWSMRNQ